MNILWVSVSMNAKTGYGVGTKTVVPYLIKNGYPTTILAYAGISDGEAEIDEVRHVIPPKSDPFANRSIIPFFDTLNSNLTIVHRDIWVNDPIVSEAVPTLAWFPVDHFPISSLVSRVLPHTKWLATMSKWGVTRLNKAGYEATYLPHSFNPYIFNNKERKERKEIWGNAIPEDVYLITMVAANRDWPPRKGFIEAFMAVSKLMQKHKDIWMYIHSNVSIEEGGADLIQLSKLCGMDPNRIIFTSPFEIHRGLPEKTLANIYKASDLYLSASHAEGFGIPILEAQACGIPVVLADNSSQTELCFKGKLVPCELEASLHYTWLKKPIISELEKAIESSYLERNKKDNDVPIALNNFTDEYVFNNNWIPLLNKIQEELE